MTGEVESRPCRDCGRPIVLAFYPKTGRWIVLDAKQTRGGRYAVEEDANGKLVARLLSHEEREASPVWERRPHATVCKPKAEVQLGFV